jgi:hypothetical protein
MTEPALGRERPSGRVRSAVVSAELKARVADFMERSGELLSHDLATYKGADHD